MKNSYILNKMLILTIFFILLVFSSGCSKKQPYYVILSSNPITQSTFQTEKTFKVGEKINFAVLAPSGFQNPLVRIQIIKQNAITHYIGYTMEHARDIEIDTSKNFFIDSFYIYSAGGFYFRVFSHADFQKPLVQTDFSVTK
jgi:hypothetical protein